MKNLLKLAPLCACLLAVASAVLLMVTPALTHSYQVLGKTVNDFYSAFAVIFGNGPAVLLSISTTFEGSASWSALLAWVFVLASAVLLLVSTIASFVKAKSVLRFAGLIALLSAGLLIAGGIFLFFTKSTFYTANGYSVTDDGYGLGFGWILAAIFALAGGVFSILPATVALVSKK